MNSSDDYSMAGPSRGHEVSGLAPLAGASDPTDRAARGRGRKRRRKPKGNRRNADERNHQQPEDGDGGQDPAGDETSRPGGIDYLA